MNLQEESTIGFSSTVLVSISDARGIIQYVNEQFCETSQYKKEELIGQSHVLLKSDYHQKDFFNTLWQTIESGLVWRGEILNKRKDASLYWVDATIVPLLGEDHKPSQYVCIQEDIAQQLSQDIEIKNSLKELSDYKYALDQAAIVAITDHKGRITYVNDYFIKISQYSYDELIGQDHRIINSGYHPKAFIKELWTTIANGKVWKGEIKNRAKDGSFYWVDTTIIPFLNSEGKPYQYVSIRSDITEKKKAEEEIVQFNQKISEHAVHLEKKNTQLVDFTNIVSHNLRAPLVNMSMLIEIFEESEDEEDRKEIISKLKPVISHLNEVFNELIESIQIRQEVDVVYDWVDLESLVAKTLNLFEGQIQQYDMEIRCDFSALKSVKMPLKYAESICTNLISNAIKYRSETQKPSLDIKSEIRDKHAVLSFKDNGLGIDLKMHQNRMFKIRSVFHKHPEAKGFGLFMTKTQVETLGGKIWVESEVDKGSTFFIELPII